MEKKSGGRKIALAAADRVVDLKTLIHDHSLFFDRLVELIPARFYLPADDDKPYYQGLSKAAKASCKAESRKHLKEVRRARFDPANSTTTLDHVKKTIEAAKAEANSSDDGDENDDSGETDVDNPRRPVISDDRSMTYEELRQRLQRRIEECRSRRNTRPLLNVHKPDKMGKKKSKNKKIPEGDASTSLSKQQREHNETGKGQKRKKVPVVAGEDAVPDIAFGQVNLGGEDEHRRKKRKLSKQHELERAKRLVEAKNDAEKGQEFSKKHSWKTASSRAAGVKVHDDPKLLKESINKKKKRQQKHVEKWKERIKNTQKQMSDKQKNRAENIRERINQKKMRRIEKREKKLMRPGFEGRKEGYINE